MCVCVCVDVSVCPTLDSLLSIGYRVYLRIKVHIVTCSYLTANFVMLTHTGGCLLSPTLTVLKVKQKSFKYSLEIAKEYQNLLSDIQHVSCAKFTAEVTAGPPKI